MAKTKQVFKGRLLNLYLERRRLPNGYVLDLEIIRHPGAVLLVPFLNQDTVILIRQFRPVIHSYIWELPAGTLHARESYLACARRELREEIGYQAGVLKRIGYIYPAPGYTTERIVIYEARKLKKVEARAEADEIISLRPFSRRELGRLLRRGRIVDAKTICALKLAGVV